MALPSGYTQLEYIESNGSQYIDTGFGSTRGWTAEFDWMFTVSPVSEQDVIGSVFISGSTYYREYVLCRDNQWALGHYSNYAYSGSAVANTKYSIKASTVSGNGSLTVNGTQIHKHTTTYQSHTAHNVYVFAMNVSGAEGFASGRLYSLKLYNHSNSLVRDFIPCKNASGVAGLWDDVNSKFYGSAGSEPFVAGTILDPMTPHDGHNTNIGNVAREIECGTALIGGVLREFESGLALVGGVSREIEFDLGAVVLTVANKDNYYNKYNANYAYAMVGDTRLNPNEMSSMEVPYGTIVAIKLKATNSSNPAKVIVNGTTTFQNSGTYSYTTHEYVAKRNAKITYSTQIIYIDEE